ncbi:MAG TPA: hypothetical protein VG817_00020, partial [Gemmatimonadales bacterium]|nr:hypothetical protein [Gemmatimonadales bacterium]
AEQVAQALGVALADSVSRKLAAQPTTNLQAYEAYLHGEQQLFGKGSYDPPTLRTAIAHYQEAVALDSTFSLAWSRLARATSLLYVNGVPPPALPERALRAAERTQALAPNTVHGYLAMAAYYRDIRADYAAARRETLKALALEPRNPEVVGGLAGLESALGQWDSAVVHAREATRLDPRALVPAERLGNALRKLGRHREARAELDRARAFAPAALALLQDRVMVELRDGDMDSARAIFRGATAVVPAEMVAHFANSWDLYWVLDDAQQRLLLTLPPESFGDDRASWAIVRAQTHWLRGDSALTRAYADSARLATLEILKVAPRDPQRLILLGLSYAFLGQRAEAVRHAERGLALTRGIEDQQTTPYYQHLVARIHTLTGAPDQAIDILERLLKVPYEFTPASLRIDPNFAPLKGHPRFEKLIAAR